MLITALIIGFAGSLHCVGMCSPLAMLISGANKQRILINQLLYNAGRVITYSILGLFMGLIGVVVSFSGLQSMLSIGLGIFIILVVLFPRIEASLSPSLNLFLYRIKSGIGNRIKKSTCSSSVVTGILNGLLPCGMVYMALALAVIQDGLWSSVGFMTMFGLGTFPALLAAVYFASIIRKLIPVSWRRIQVTFFVLLAILMIGRGFQTDFSTHSHPVTVDGITECK
ncbi:MAG: sulfite exporter TauE/SafE family protein [Cyclobacteriaceae bacterium]|nr:sulfite exporter TauE/SafE family protein [Cyclobacteriaceae bacterium]